MCVYVLLPAVLKAGVESCFKCVASSPGATHPTEACYNCYQPDIKDVSGCANCVMFGTLPAVVREGCAGCYKVASGQKQASDTKGCLNCLARGKSKEDGWGCGNCATPPLQGMFDKCYNCVLNTKVPDAKWWCSWTGATDNKQTPLLQLYIPKYYNCLTTIAREKGDGRNCRSCFERVDRGDTWGADQCFQCMTSVPSTVGRAWCAYCWVPGVDVAGQRCQNCLNRAGLTSYSPMDDEGFRIWYTCTGGIASSSSFAQY